MIDARLRARLEGPLDAVAARLDRPGITPDRLTVLGLVLGLTSAGLAAGQLWWWALGAWWVSRVLDGLDGPLARRRVSRARGQQVGGGEGCAAGGFLDITADFTVYGAAVLGVAVGVVPDPAGTGDWLPFLAVLLAYYVNGTAFLAFSSVAERSGRRLDDGRSLNFLGGLAEGAETLVVHSLWLVWPERAGAIATVWAVVVGAGAAQRVVVGRRMLAGPP